jgi:hypothetical protein
MGLTDQTHLMIALVKMGKIRGTHINMDDSVLREKANYKIFLRHMDYIVYINNENNKYQIQNGSIRRRERNT